MPLHPIKKLEDEMYQICQFFKSNSNLRTFKMNPQVILKQF